MTVPARRRRAPLTVAVAVLALLAGVIARPAAAQTGAAPEPTTTLQATTTTTTLVKEPTTTVPPTTSTTVADPLDPPPGPPTSGPVTPPPGPVAPPPVVDTKAEDSSEEPPPRAKVPPRAIPRILTPADLAVARVLEEQLKATQQSAGEALAASQAADRVLAAAEAEQAEVQRGLDALRVDESASAQRLVEQRQSIRTRAVAIYVSGPGEPIIPVGDDLHEYGRRRVLVEALHAADRRIFDGYTEAKAAAGDQVAGLVDRLEDLHGTVLAARADSEAKAAATQGLLRNVNLAQAGGRLAINGFAFPVADPHSFASTFGAPRSGGRLHQGNDIFAPYGTPLPAAERGVVGKMGADTLGGIKLWISGESGTSYYYAHLSAFAANVVNGTVVEVGDVVGFVGDSGNARGTSPHLHFEIHPSNGPAIDPYPVLKAADDAGRQQAAQQATAAQPPALTAAP